MQLEYGYGILFDVGEPLAVGVTTYTRCPPKETEK